MRQARYDFDETQLKPYLELDNVQQKGVNVPHGGLRYYFENETLQDVNISQTLAAALGNTSGKGNRTDKYQDYGFDLGGPLLENVVWIWGTMSKTAIDLLTLNGASDSTSFTNYAFKADGKLNDKVRGNFTFYENNKQKTGRDAGPTRPPETTWDQAGPSRLYKGEGTFIAGKNFSLRQGRFHRCRLHPDAGRRSRDRLLHRRRRRRPQLVLSSTRARGRSTTPAATPATSPAGTS